MENIYLKFKNGTNKAVTLSYDDGGVHDKRLVEILNRYGLKGTFNLNSGRMLSGDANVYRELYTGHEVAVHTASHPFPHLITMPEMVQDVLEDRRNLENIFGGIVNGMAYPMGTYTSETITAIKACGIVYSRTTMDTMRTSFPPKDWHEWHPTCHQNNPKLMELAKKFVEGVPYQNAKNSVFYLWGHSFEFDKNDNWHVLEEFGEYIGGRENIWYATNNELYRYVQAFKRLERNVDNTYIYNPTDIDLWIKFQHGDVVKIRSGEVLLRDKNK